MILHSAWLACLARRRSRVSTVAPSAASVQVGSEQALGALALVESLFAESLGGEATHQSKAA